MARCVISEIVYDDQATLACMVHTAIAPCDRDGQPASLLALHTDSIPTPETARDFWRQRTGEQRPLVIHAGSFADGHDLTSRYGRCCASTFVPGEGVSGPGGGA